VETLLTHSDISAIDRRRTRRSQPDKRSWLHEWLTSPGKIAGEYIRAHGRRVEELTSHGSILTIASRSHHRLPRAAAPESFCSTIHYRLLWAARRLPSGR
jgi:hypothetical protein